MNIHRHNYLGVNFTTRESLGTYRAELDGIEITGTTSQSRGEAAMRFMLMLEGMQDYESKPVQAGDLIEFGDKRVGMIAEIGEDGDCVVREGIGDGDSNVRTLTGNIVLVILRGEMTALTPKQLEWVGVGSAEYACSCIGVDAGFFKYDREVNIWKHS